MMRNLSHISYNDETWHGYALSKEDPKNVWVTWYIPWVLLTSEFFHWESANAAISRNTDTDSIWYIIFNSLFESSIIVEINMVQILKMSAKIATLGLLKIKVLWNKVYDVIIFIHDVNKKILSRDLSYIVDVVTWPKFGNSSNFMREVFITSII